MHIIREEIKLRDYDWNLTPLPQSAIILAKASIKLLESLTPLGSSRFSLQPSSLPLAPFSYSFSLYLFSKLMKMIVQPYFL